MSLKLRTVLDDEPELRQRLAPLDLSTLSVDDVRHAMFRERVTNPPKPFVRLAGRHEAWDYVAVEHAGVWWLWGQRAGGTIGTRGWELQEARSILDGRTAEAANKGPRRRSLEIAKTAVEQAEMAAPRGASTPANPFTTREAGRIRGAAAFADGLKAVPYHDPHLREAYTKGPVPTNEYLAGWAAGWDEANLAAPVDDSPGPTEPRFLKALRDKTLKEVVEVFRRRVETAEDDADLAVVLRDLDELISEELDTAVYVLQLSEPPLDEKKEIERRVRTAVLAEYGPFYNERAAELNAPGLPVVPIDYEGIEEAGQETLFGAYRPTTEPLRSTRFAPERIVGGRADGRSPSEFDQDALARGSAIEREHTDDPGAAQEIAMDHLAEHPDYYDEERGLPAMEDRLSKVVVDSQASADADYRAVVEAMSRGEEHARQVGRDLDVPDDLVEEAIEEYRNAQAQRAEAEIDVGVFRAAPPSSAAWEHRVRAWLEETLSDVFIDVDQGRNVYVKIGSNRYQFLWSLRAAESPNAVLVHVGLRRGAEEHHAYGRVETQEDAEALLRRLAAKIAVDNAPAPPRPAAPTAEPSLASDPRVRNALRWIGLGNRPTAAMTAKGVRGRSLLDELISAGYVERDGASYVLTERGERETLPTGFNPSGGAAGRSAPAAATWSQPAYDDEGNSSAVSVVYLPADPAGVDRYAVTWFNGTLEGPDPSERDPFYASPLGKDFPTLAKAKRAVEREYARRNPDGEHAALRKLPIARTRRQRLKAAALAGAHGKDWYKRAQREVDIVAKAWGVAPEVVAVAVAATSPATAVVISPRMTKGGGRGSNIAKARSVVKHLVVQGARGSGALHPRTPGLSRLHEFEECLHTGGTPPSCVEVAFPTPDRVKTHAFVRNLLGDKDAVTVDRHVARTAAGESVEHITPNQHEEIVQDMRAVARELGWEPRQVMAAVWTAAGGTGELTLATAAERERVGRSPVTDRW